MDDLWLTSGYTEPGVSLTGITGPTVGAGWAHLVYRVTFHVLLHEVVADHQGHVGVAGLVINVLGPPTAWLRKLSAGRWRWRDLTYFIRPGPGEYGKVFRGGLVGVVGDVRQLETVDLIVPVPHHFLHTGLPDLPVVLSFEGDQVLSVLEEKCVIKDP